MALVLASSIAVQTNTGEKVIQLLVGDITKLPKEDEVDVLVISAFPGDYTPTATSVIGALLRNNGISVRKLADDKEEDLRRRYYCWWSKPLDPEHSYRQILCFEPNFGLARRHPGQLVGEVFRCLVPFLSNKTDGKVMMPLLASGDMGNSKRGMMSKLVDTAVKWMKAGLPLNDLKIVMYSPTPHKLSKDVQGRIDFFNHMKEEYEKEDKVIQKKKTGEESDLKYDLYLSFSKQNAKNASSIQEVLKSEKESISIFAERQSINDEEGWQDGIFDVMVTCARVVALLSPTYLDSMSCTEQYNMALCHSKRTRTDILAPFYLETVDNLPTYMGLIQYTDCRPYDRTKMVTACKQLLAWLEMQKPSVIQAPSMQPLRKNMAKYDVFISYCHANNEHAHHMLEELKSKNPDLKIFIDTSELKIGNTWQLALYEAIEGARCLVSLLSPEYVSSKVCQEEFSLALHLHSNDPNKYHFVSMIIEPVASLPVAFTHPLPVDCTEEQSSSFERVSQDVVTRLEEMGNMDQKNDKQQKKIQTDEMLENLRKLSFLESKLKRKHRSGKSDEKSPEATAGNEIIVRNDPESEDLNSATASDSGPQNQDTSKSSQDEYDIALSFSKEDEIYAQAFEKLLLHENPDLRIHKSYSGSHSTRMNILDTAKVIVPFLSVSYTSDQDLINELQISLFRHRWGNNFICFPIQVSSLSPSPAYVHLIPCQFSILDKFWNNVVDGQMENHFAEISAFYVDRLAACCLTKAVRALLEQMQGSVMCGDPFKRVILNLKEIELHCERSKFGKTKGQVGQVPLQQGAIPSVSNVKEGVTGSADKDGRQHEEVERNEHPPPEEQSTSQVTVSNDQASCSGARSQQHGQNPSNWGMVRGSKSCVID